MNYPLKIAKSITVCLGIIVLSGCGVPSDPKSNVPQLSGYWKVTNDKGRLQGYIHFDDTGDPVEIRANNNAYALLKEKAVFVDGQKHSTQAGYEYAAIGNSTQNGSTLTVNLQILIYMAGVQAGSANLTLTGTLTTSDKIQGNLNSTQQVPGYPSDITEGGTAVRVTQTVYSAS